ncbi:MAG: class I SAM-dependent methyltransferase [Alphaproteobacteria bacterium]|nr:class I SAM-dependent methyltransferase [Alphaproteobacteria bacterium]
MDLTPILKRLRHGDHAARAEIEALCRQFPEDAHLLAARFHLAMRDGDESGAAALAEQIASRDAAEVTAWVNALLYLGGHREAIAVLERRGCLSGGGPMQALLGLLLNVPYLRAYALDPAAWPFDPTRLTEPALPRMPEPCRGLVARIVTTGHGEGPATPQAGGEVTAADGDVLFNLAQAIRPRRTLEVGFAKGLSTLYLLSGGAGAIERHTVIDPMQRSAYHYNGVRNVTAAGHGDKLRLMEMPSQVALPRLLSTGEAFDLIFIDGNHSFESAFVDAFHADQLSEPGTILAFHDCVTKPVGAVLDFMVTNRGYEMLERGNVAILRRVRATWNGEEHWVPFRTGA